MDALPAAATVYLNAGLSVVALTGKRPNTIFHEHGLLNALTGKVETDEDHAVIERVFTHPTTTGVGILIPMHMLVADVDSEEAAALLMELCEGKVPETPATRTRNGIHVWFLAPGADRSLWIGGRTLLFRGSGSFVVAPPSAHPDGGVYTWLWPLVGPSGVVGSEPPGGVSELPDAAWARIVNALSVAQVNHRKVTITEHHAQHVDGVWRVRPVEVPGTIDGLAHAVEEAQSGNRNNMLAWSSMTAAEEGYPLDVAMQALLPAAKKVGLSDREATVTIRAAYRRKRS